MYWFEVNFASVLHDIPFLILHLHNASDAVYGLWSFMVQLFLCREKVLGGAILLLDCE